MPGFVQQFITPIVKVSKGTQAHQFYSLPEYRAWLQTHNNGKGWHIKYYKGLGTSTAQEAKDYFSRIDKHRKDFVWAGDEDGDRIDMAFSKKKANDRKVWLDECFTVRVLSFVYVLSSLLPFF